MTDKLKSLQDFYKAQAIRDPLGLATYVTTRYGKLDKFGMAQGMAGKANAKEWNKVKNVAAGGAKSGQSAQVSAGGTRQRELAYQVPTKRKLKSGEIKRGKKTVPWMPSGSKGTKERFPNLPKDKRSGKSKSSRKSIELDKAQDIYDSRRLAAGLSGRAKRSVTLWHDGEAPKKPWHVYEGGIRGKANAKEWNPLVGGNTDIRGYEYEASGKRIPKGGKKDKKELAREQKRVPGKGGKGTVFGGKKGAAQFTLPGFEKPKTTKKSMDILKGGAVPKKFGGTPLKWEDLPRDPISFATNVLNHKGFWYSNLTANSKGAKLRNKLARGLRELIREVPEAGKKEQKEGRIQDQKEIKEAQEMSEEMENSWKNGDHDMKKEKIKKSSTLSSIASLLGYGAGWAMSDTFTEAPRGRMTPSQQRDWERLVRSSMRRKKGLTKEAIDDLRTYYNDQSDTYVRRKPIDNALNIIKDHAPIPPRQGLVWDEQKKHWTRPEHIGHSVVEVQGKKRVRGTGTGVHEHNLAVGRTGGKGSGMSAEAGRRFRSAADAGIANPHESKHPSKHHLNTTKPAKRAVNNFLARRGHKTRH